MENQWNRNCQLAQEALWQHFFDPKEKVMGNHFPARTEENWIYWWHAHALDALLDGYVRQKDGGYRERFCAEYEGTFRENKNSFLHNWYDDMEWMALALLRAWDIFQEDCYKQQALLIWEDIKTAWNDACGGGMAWKKDQLDYKNTPANAPAAILAFRLYERFGRKEDLEWGRKIFAWNKEHLMDPDTCFIWDGMNREGDGKIDKDWKFSYCQGVMVGAALEYYRITKEKEHLVLAEKIARRAVTELAGKDLIFEEEGPDDCGLFRGIYFRYLYELIAEDAHNCEDLKDVLSINAKAAGSAMREDGLIGKNWRGQNEGEIDLAQHLSGLMVLEMAAKLQNEGAGGNGRRKGA